MIGPLVGAIIAGILVIALLVFLFFFLRKRRRVKTEHANFKVNDNEKLETVSSIIVNNSNTSSPKVIYNNSTYPIHPSFNPRFTSGSVNTYDDDETCTNYEEPLTIQQQLNYIKKQQLKLQREEIRERQRLQNHQQNLNSPVLVRQAAGSPTSPSHYDSYLRYVTDSGQLNKPSPSSSLFHINRDSIASESSVNSYDIRNGHASNIVPIAYIPGVTSNFSSKFASSPTSSHNNNNNHSSQNILALSAAQQQCLSTAPISTDSMISYDPRFSLIPVHSAITAARAQPQLVVNMKYANPVDSDMISIEPDLDRRPEELNSLKSCNKSNKSFSDEASINSKGLDNELYQEIESYLVHGAPTVSSINGSNKSDTSNNMHNISDNNDTIGPVSTTTHISTGTPRSSWRVPIPAQRSSPRLSQQRNSQRSTSRVSQQRNSQRSASRVSQQRNSQRNSQSYRLSLSLRDSTSDDTWRLQPFDYPVIFDNDDDISFVKK